MADTRKRISIRLPQDAYDRLCAETPSISTDTARFQHVVQFYLDYKDHGHTPAPPRNSTGNSTDKREECDDSATSATSTDPPSTNANTGSNTARSTPNGWNGTGHRQPTETHPPSPEIKQGIREGGRSVNWPQD